MALGILGGRVLTASRQTAKAAISDYLPPPQVNPQNKKNCSQATAPTKNDGDNFSNLGLTHSRCLPGLLPLSVKIQRLLRK